MNRTIVLGVVLLTSAWLAAADEKSSLPTFDYDTARNHEIKPHRRTVPHEGVRAGFNQLRLTLTVSAAGDVTSADAQGEADLLKVWPDLESEVYQWKFVPFERDGKPVAATVEEYIDLVPPERLPMRHVPAPAIRHDSKIAIVLERSGCYGTCPSYAVTVSTEGIVFDGGGYVAARGRHTDSVDAEEVRMLAKKFVAADFYSMDHEYLASVTDCPTYTLSISIDGEAKKVTDYVGEWVGMPAVVSELEEDVDALAHTDRWIGGKGGLVEALQAEKYDFHTFEAQVLLKEALTRGETGTAEALLEAGVSLKPMHAPKPKEAYEGVPFDHVGWLTAAAEHPDVLKILIDQQASRDDQEDKDLALLNAARKGSLDSVRRLMAYGANPNADLSKYTIAENGGGGVLSYSGRGNILIYAAASGNPDVVREILKHHPKLEARGQEGQTAIFAAGDYRSSDMDGARVECVRLLAAAGADVNARDGDGNTPLHEIYLTDVEEELLNLGADVNAQNKDGDTPIVTNVDNDGVLLLLKHGADLTLRNNKGQTMLEAAQEKGPARAEALQKAIAEMKAK